MENDALQDVYYKLYPMGFSSDLSTRSIDNNNVLTLYDVPIDYDVKQYIIYLANYKKIDPKIIFAIIKTESMYKYDIISKTNDYGLMQINKVNHEWLKMELGVNDLLNPRQNVKAGIHIFSNLLNKYNNLNQALMAYNMGETGAKRLWDKGIYETQYTRKVMINMESIYIKEYRVD